MEEVEEVEEVWGWGWFTGLLGYWVGVVYWVTGLLGYWVTGWVLGCGI